MAGPEEWRKTNDLITRVGLVRDRTIIQSDPELPSLLGDLIDRLVLLQNQVQNLTKERDLQNEWAAKNVQEGNDKIKGLRIDVENLAGRTEATNQEVANVVHFLEVHHGYGDPKQHHNCAAPKGCRERAAFNRAGM